MPRVGAAVKVPAFDGLAGSEAHLVDVERRVLRLVPRGGHGRVLRVGVVGAGRRGDVLRDGRLKLRCESQEASRRS